MSRNGSPALDRATVTKVAVLARLKLTEQEIDDCCGQLGAVLEYVHVLDELDTTNVEPLVHAFETTKVFRADEVRPSLPRDAALANAPKSDGRCFLVPRIIDAGPSS
jgi:aspartyl-tRNA(Asn)/glutamyl-tRNA(Gln) amidotransferase subunit C